jgi:hypothetical protein
MTIIQPQKPPDITSDKWTSEIWHYILKFLQPLDASTYNADPPLSDLTMLACVLQAAKTPSRNGGPFYGPNRGGPTFSNSRSKLETQTLLSRTRPCLRVYCKTAKTPRASPSPFQSTAAASMVTILFRSRSKNMSKEDLRLCSPPWTTRAP